MVIRRTGRRSTPGAERFQHPGRMIAAGFATAILFGTGLLSLPLATESGERTDFIDALFTSTSAVCVTGLITVDTGGHWSTFGEVVVLALIQAGGLGIMTLATLVTILVSRRLGLRARMLAQAETKTLRMRDIRRVIRNIVIFSAVSELVFATILTVRFATAYDESLGDATYLGVFHAISAFNNAGFSLHADSLMGYVTDPWISLTIVAAFVLGGLGFPVVFELLRAWRRPREWSVLTWITMVATGFLLFLGTIVMTLAERSNPETLGPLSGSERLLAGFFAAATPRTAGFNTIDVSQMTPEGWLATDILMFIGGGSAGTAGGIKVTTFGLLAFVIWAELRGDSRVNVGYRRIPDSTQRQAITIALLAVGLVVSATFVLSAMTPHTLDQVLFEAISAFGTVGMSTGITADLSQSAEVVIILLMFVGRIGPLTMGTALALRERIRRYELPEERPIVG